MTPNCRFATLRMTLGLALAGAAIAEPSLGAPQLPQQGQIVVIDAPSNLGLRPPKPGAEPGVKHLATALRKTGLVEHLGARDAGRVEAPPYSPAPDPAVGFRNGTSLSRYSETLGRRLETLLADGDFVLVLGGDCSVLVGAGVALKGRGRYGLAFIDGHDDFSYARDRARYHGIFAAAGLDLALATGNGPPQLSHIAGRSPYFRTDDAVQIGLSRTKADTQFAATETFERSGIKTWPVEEIERRGARTIALEAKRKLETSPTEGFWIHLDADVLDAKIMPAVDSPNDRGLTFEQLKQILATLLSSPKAVGLEVTVFDPDLDPDRTLARKLAETIEQAFAESGRFNLPKK